MGGHGTCKAEGCNQVFAGEEAFNMHRVGSFGKAIYYPGKGRNVKEYTKPERRCLTAPEMLELGMDQNKKGWWTKGTATRTKRREFLEKKQISFDEDDMSPEEEPEEEEETTDVT